MAEGNQNQSSEPQEKTFTQSELDAIIGDRLARQKEKFADYDDLKSKAAEYDKQQAANKSELQKAQEENKRLTDRLAGIEKQSRINDIRAKVSRDTGVTAELLTGEDEETCKKQADAIKKYAESYASNRKYPGVRGNAHAASKASGSDDGDRDAFRELAGQIFGRKE